MKEEERGLPPVLQAAKFELENKRLWNLLKRTRKHRDLLLRNLRNQLEDMRVETFMSKIQRNRDHIDNLHTEINQLERRKLELKATIMMMGGKEYT